MAKFISFLAVSKDEIKPDLQNELQALGVKNIVAGKIRSGGAPEENITKAMDYFSLYDDSLKKVTQSIDNVINAEDLDHVAFHLTVQGVMDNLLGKYQELLNFAAVQRYDVKTFSHILNVSILSMYFSSRMGFSKDAVREIGVAALFHDIGKIYISRKIIRKPGALTEQEKENIPVFSQKMLVKIIQDRVTEIFDLANKELKKVGRDGKLPAGIVLCGGGVKLPQIEDLAKKVFKLTVSIGIPREFSNIDADPSLAGACGLVVSGWDEREDDGSRESRFPAMGGSGWDKIKKFFKIFVP